MRFTLRNLTLALKKESVVIPFHSVNYFHGKMGAGKTSIARLVDYCLGGSLDPSPALQSEFVSTALELELANTVLTVERGRDSDRVVATWGGDQEEHRLSLPARKGAGVVLPGTDVENLSDLVFYLSGIVPPRVRTSKTREDAELRRLSLRDLLWYCYLDQDEIDSNFFHLDQANDPKMYKSRDVLRFILGFHGERIAEIEAELEKLRGERQAITLSIAGFQSVLAEVGVDSEGDLLRRVEGLKNEADRIGLQLDAVREQGAEESQLELHSADNLRGRARELGQQLAQIDIARTELTTLVGQDRLHVNEIETLTLKFRRSTSAKAVLQGVSFTLCPRCTQTLPGRGDGLCTVCGQSDETTLPDTVDNLLLERDAKGRIDELKEVLLKRSEGIRQLEREREELLAEKGRIEKELGDVTRRYDSIYLSRALVGERERAAILQRAADLESMLRFPRLVSSQKEHAERIAVRESTLRSELKAQRALAERDASHLDRLKELFLDCLLRTAMPGISPDDSVTISSKDFVPQVWGPEAIASSVTSFSNMSSGGKKTLFKCCFAIAVHRLAAESGATLPEMLILDSPMKNISERENREQFERFHRMLYELHAEEFPATQLVLIDKEYFPPEDDTGLEVYERHMQPNEPGESNPHPPLIPYYLGH